MRIEQFNQVTAEDARQLARFWADVATFTDEVLAHRPYASRAAVHAVLDEQAKTWGEAELIEALRSHARIGQRPTEDSVHAAASRREQAAMSDADSVIAARIASGNAAYEQKFGRVFLIRAAGRSPHEIAAELDRRLRLDLDSEVAEAAAQLAQIAALRIDQTFTDHDAETSATPANGC